MSLGELMQIATAFVQVQIALNWLVDNAIRLAEWLASAQRVLELRPALRNARPDDRPRRPQAHRRPRRQPGGRAPHQATSRSRSRTACLMIEGGACQDRARRQDPGEGRIGHRQEHPGSGPWPGSGPGERAASCGRGTRMSPSCRSSPTCRRARCGGRCLSGHGPAGSVTRVLADALRPGAGSAISSARLDEEDHWTGHPLRRREAAARLRPPPCRAAGHRHHGRGDLGLG